LSQERIDDIKARWTTADQETKDQLFAEVAESLARKVKEEGVRLAIVLPEKSGDVSRETPRDVYSNLACREFPCTDIGNSQRFARRKKSVARYCHAHRSWFVWDGKRWGKDLIGKAIEHAKDTILRIGDEATSSEYSDESARLFKWAAASQARPRIDACLYLAQSVIAIEPLDLDARSHLLNLPNGTLNLVSCELQPHRKDDFLTKMADVEYRPGETCPQWIEHLDLIFNKDKELIDAFRQVVGYTLLQDNPEQVMFILYGSGKNGKTATLEILSHLFGEYAINIAAETLMSKRFNEGPRSDIARISNARLVSASEGESGARLAESLVKALTGGDIVTVRRLYENEIQFRPTAKIFYATNHRPVIQGTDDAIWRRIWLIPFMSAIPEERRDPDIVAKILKERSGILNWALAGLQKYRQVGRLIQPESVKVAVEEYRQDSDVLKEFLEDWTQPTGKIKRSDLYRAYTDWCEQNHEKPVGSKKFVGMIRERGIRECRDVKDRYWDGISSRGFWK
jgi:putative DNA primase/helicase